MAKFERSAKGKKKQRVAAGFAIALSVILLIEGISMGVIWGGRAAEKKKNAPVVISFGKQNPGREIALDASAAAINRYVYARLLNEKLERFDENGSLEEFQALMDETELAWAEADRYMDKLDEMGAVLEAEEEKDGYLGVYKSTEIASLEDSGTPVIHDPFALYAKAADKDMIEWAKEIQEYYDRAPAGKGIRLLSCVLKEDTAHAAIRFQQAQAILRGEADIDEINQTYHINNCKTAAAVGKAAGTAAAILAVPATGVTLLSGTAILASGVDATVNVMGTEASIRLGDEHVCVQQIDKVAEYTGMAATITSFWTLPGSSGWDKALFGVGALADGVDGKILGGVVDIDADGGVKMFGFEMKEGETSKAERRANIKKSVREIAEKYDQIFLKKPNLDDKIDKLADALDQAEEAKKEGKSAAETSLSDVPDDYLNKACDVFREKTEAMDAGGVDLMDKLLEDFYDALDNGSLFVIIETDEEEYLYFPKVEDVAGAWDVNLTFTNMESELVNAIVRGLVEALSTEIEVEDKDALVDDTIKTSVNYNEAASISGYMNIEPTGKNTARVTMYLYGDDGEPVTVIYSGKMNKQGVMKLKMKGYRSGSEDGAVDIGLPYMEFDFYGIGDGRYTSGTYHMDSYALTADIEYYGTRQRADEYWDMEGGDY